MSGNDNSKKLKVMNIIEEGRYGGPQAVITSVAAKLKKFDVETIVVFPREGSEVFFDKLMEYGISSIRIPLHRPTMQKTHLIKYLLFFIPDIISLYKIIKRENADIIHCNSFFQIKGMIAASLAGVKRVWHLHDTMSPFYVRVVAYFFARYLCNNFITAGERVRAYYLDKRHMSNKNISVIQSPVDTSRYESSIADHDEKMLGFRGLRIVTVGNVNPLKGIEYFIQMAAILNSEYNGLVFLVVGPLFDSQKQYGKKIHELAERLEVKNLIFYGPSDKVASVLKSADIYVCSSVSEASPISVWEAMAMAKPIVSSDVGDVSRFIRDGENGCVVPIKDPAALAERVGLLIENEHLRKELGQKARDTAVEHLDVNVCAKEHAELYRKM